DRGLVSDWSSDVCSSDLVVHPAVPARSVKEFIALAKKQPGKLNYASSGIGSPPSTSLNATDVLGGHVEVMFASPPFAQPFVQAGGPKSGVEGRGGRAGGS